MARSSGSSNICAKTGPWLLVAAAFFSVMAMCGCNGAQAVPQVQEQFGYYGWGHWDRRVDIFLVTPIPTTVPADVRVQMSAPGGGRDFYEHFYGEKIEFSFGDSTDWIDVTQEMHKLLHGQLLPSQITPHHYTEPGTYRIRARVTFWDGEVVYSDPESIEITVLPPEGG